MRIQKQKLFFESISQKEAKNYRSIIGNFTVQDSKGKIENMLPELRIYNQPNITTSEADIKTTLLSDKFMVINIVQNQEFFNVRYQVKTIYVMDLDFSNFDQFWWVNEFFKKRI